MLVEHRLLGKADAVNTRQLRTLFVAAPVRPGDVEQLDGLDRLRGREVRPAAEVRKAALRVERDLPIFEATEEIQLVGVAFVFEVRRSLSLRDFAALEGAARASEFFHLGLDRGQRVRPDRRRAADGGRVDVVVEPRIDGGADPQADAGIERLERLGHEVGRRVPEGFLSVLGVPREHGDGRAVGQLAGEVAGLGLTAGRRHQDSERGTGEARGDRGREVEAGRAVGERAFGAVGERDRHRGVGRKRDAKASRPRRATRSKTGQIGAGGALGGRR